MSASRLQSRWQNPTSLQPMSNDTSGPPKSWPQLSNSARCVGFGGIQAPLWGPLSALAHAALTHPRRQTTVAVSGQTNLQVSQKFLLLFQRDWLCICVRECAHVWLLTSAFICFPSLRVRKLWCPVIFGHDLLASYACASQEWYNPSFQWST